MTQNRDIGIAPTKFRHTTYRANSLHTNKHKLKKNPNRIAHIQTAELYLNNAHDSIRPNYRIIRVIYTDGRVCVRVR